jgi:glycyl-tRNA synthetase
LTDLLEKIVSLCKRRGFVFPNSEIYGGIRGFYDYGPMGNLMKQNIKTLWWSFMLRENNDIYSLDGTIITHPKVWEASGHVNAFFDMLVDCKNCKKRWRADKVGKTCPECDGELTEPRKFNLMVETSLGVVEGEKKTAYLRGEACQTIYLDYKNVLDSMHPKIPFGIAQIGKAFRNEITPEKFLVRQREFEQWDLQWFCSPDDMDKYFEIWREKRFAWYKSLVNNPGKLRLRPHEKDELSHYAKKAVDIEYEAPFGWYEWEGIHWRGNWDLSRHGEFSGNDFTYTDGKGEKFIPNIIETSGGVDRTFLFLLFDAYNEETINDGKDTRVVLKLHPKIAPIKFAIFPLSVNKPEIVDAAKKIYQEFKMDYQIMYDDNSNIGKRYRRHDEIGTPFCVTVDFATLEDGTVTVRDRDSMKQIRIHTKELKSYFEGKFK